MKKFFIRLYASSVALSFLTMVFCFIMMLWNVPTATSYESAFWTYYKVAICMLPYIFIAIITELFFEWLEYTLDSFGY